MNTDNLEFLKKELESIEISDTKNLIKSKILEDISKSINIKKINTKKNKEESKELYNEALDLYTKKNYSKAFKLMKLATDLGNIEALFNLGDFYYLGLGEINQDESKGINIYNKAISKIDESDKVTLSKKYDELDFEVHNFRTFVLCELEAKRGNQTAQNHTGDFYYSNEIYDKAIEWYEKSVKQNNSDGQYKLAECYFNGTGVEKDYDKAIELYKSSARQNHINSQKKLAECYFNGNGVEQDYLEAILWYEKLGDRGDKEAQQLLAKCYANGIGVTKNYTTAMKWTKRLEDQGELVNKIKLNISNHTMKIINKKSSFNSTIQKYCENDNFNKNLKMIIVVIGENENYNMEIKLLSLDIENDMFKQTLKEDFSWIYNMIGNELDFSDDEQYNLLKKYKFFIEFINVDEDKAVSDIIKDVGIEFMYDYNNIEVYDIPLKLSMFKQINENDFTNDIKEIVKSVVVSGKTKFSENISQYIKKKMNIILKCTGYALEESEWKTVKSLCDMAIDKKIQIAWAYLYLFCKQKNFTNTNDIKAMNEDIISDATFKKALKYADNILKEYLLECINAIKKNITGEREEVMNSIKEMEEKIQYADNELLSANDNLNSFEGINRNKISKGEIMDDFMEDSYIYCLKLGALVLAVGYAIYALLCVLFWAYSAFKTPVTVILVIVGIFFSIALFLAIKEYMDNGEDSDLGNVYLIGYGLGYILGVSILFNIAKFLITKIAALPILQILIGATIIFVIGSVLVFVYCKTTLSGRLSKNKVEEYNQLKFDLSDKQNKSDNLNDMRTSLEEANNNKNNMDSKLEDLGEFDTSKYDKI